MFSYSHNACIVSTKLIELSYIQWSGMVYMNNMKGISNNDNRYVHVTTSFIIFCKVITICKLSEVG